MSRLVAVAIVAALAVGAWLSWPAPTEEDRVRAVVHAIVDAAESGDVGDVLAHVSENYRTGDAGKPELRALLTAQFLGRGPITVLPGDVAVDIDGERAHASFDALLAEGSRDWKEVFPVKADGWHLEVSFAREGEDWRIVSAERSDLDGLP